jgi:copper resistance protein C
MRRYVILLVTPLLAVHAAVAHAHALLDHASPLVGSTVSSAPKALTLWFTQKLEPAFGRVEVRDATGARVDSGKPVVDRGDPAVMRVGLKPLKSGTYQVHWRVLSVDTHTTEGTFSFSVGP